MPVLPSKFNPNNTWKDKLEYREKTMAQRHNAHHEARSEHTTKLVPLETGMKVFIQNQTGNKPRRWDKTRTVMEFKDFDQYLVKVDGSGSLETANTSTETRGASSQPSQSCPQSRPSCLTLFVILHLQITMLENHARTLLLLVALHLPIP